MSRPATSDSTAPAGDVLAVRGLSAHYGKVAALTDLSVRVGAGRIVTVIGGNGAGKSTLLNAIMGALPTGGHSRGAVDFLGHAVHDWAIERKVAHGMSLVPERRELFGSMSVEDNLLLGGFARWRRGQRDQAERMREVFALFPRLDERRAQPATTLSGGERQMLAIGRALMARPRLLMLDEPTASLDPSARERIEQLIREIATSGCRVLMTSHNLGQVSRLADEVVFLHAGRLLERSRTPDFFRGPRSTEAQAFLLGELPWHVETRTAA